MLLINKHPTIEDKDLKSLLMFVLHAAGLKTEHVMMTVIKGNSPTDPVVVNYEQLAPRGEEVCCTEVFPKYDEVGDKYSCGIALNVTVSISEDINVERIVDVEHVRLQSTFPEPLELYEWGDYFVFEVAKLVALFKEGVVGQFIQRRHWWYRTQKFAMGRLQAWEKTAKWNVDDDENGTVDLFDDVFKLKTDSNVWVAMDSDSQGRMWPRVFSSKKFAESAGFFEAQYVPVEGSGEA